MWWRIAAAAIILIIAGVAFYNYNWLKRGSKEDALAMNKKQLQDSFVLKTEEKRSPASTSFMDTPKTDKDITTPGIPSTEILSTPSASKIENGSDHTSSKQKSGSALRSAVEQDDLAKKSLQKVKPAKEETSNNPAIADHEIRENKTEAIAATSSGIASRKINGSAGQLNNFSGRVVDPNDKPLSNASLQIVEKRMSLMTDQNGQFNFTTKDSVVDIQVGLAGFEQRNFRLQNNIISNKIILEPVYQNPGEAIITGYDTQEKKILKKIQ